MRAIKITGTISPNHTLHLQLPDDVSAGPAEVIVLVPEQQTTTKAGQGLAAFLRNLRETPRKIRSKEEIDRYLNEEPASWER
jgi:hypothetical protein